MEQPITLCASALKKISICLVTANKRKGKPIKGRGRYVRTYIRRFRYNCMYVGTYMYMIHATSKSNKKNRVYSNILAILSKSGKTMAIPAVSVAMAL